MAASMSWAPPKAETSPPAAGLAPERSVLPPAKAKSPVTILMVDDQPGKLIAYEAILHELGERLIQATTGREALEQLLKNDVAVVLMDVSMPEIDGFELADMMRQHPRFQQVPIIFVSAVHMSEIDRIRGYESGAVDYISVPVVPEVLRAKVSVFAELHRKTRELQELNRDLENRVAQRSEELRRLNSQLQERVAELESIMGMLPVGVAIAEEAVWPLAFGAVVELIGNDHMARNQLLAQAADGADRDQEAHAQLLEAVDIRAAGHLARCKPVADAVTWQECHSLPSDRAKHIGVARPAKRRAQLDPLDLLQPLHRIQAAAADHADGCLWHLFLLENI